MRYHRRIRLDYSSTKSNIRVNPNIVKIGRNSFEAVGYTPTVMSVFKGSGREIPSAVMSRLPSMMQAGAVEGGN
jgi:hypothetical protein